MKVRRVALAFVSSVYLVAFGANFGSAVASTNPVTTEAYAALRSGDSAKAIALYSFAIDSRALEPEVLANALLNRALALQQQGNNDKAVDDYSAALNLDAMSSDLRATALYNRGVAQQKLGNGPLAIEDFTSALMLNPSFSYAFLSRANALRENGQYLFALSDYERAVKYKHPEMAKVYFGEAQTYDSLKRPSDARRMLQAALTVDPNYQPAREKLASLPAATASAGMATADQSAADPILTGSVGGFGGSTTVHKPDLPVGVEPPAELLAQASTAGAEQHMAAAEQPEFKKTPKIYTDRIESAESVAVVATKKVEPKAITEEVVAVASVPAIPKSAAKAVAKPAITEDIAATETDSEPPADAVETASIQPASDTPPTLQTAKTEKGWSVQIASASSEGAAWTTWKNMQKKFKVLSDKAPIVTKADLGAKGTFYRVRLAGFENQNGAKSECGNLKAKGVTCFVSKVEG